jgi:hypothetical protein
LTLGVRWAKPANYSTPGLPWIFQSNTDLPVK